MPILSVTGKPPATVVYTSQFGNVTASSTQTFSGMSIGTADGTRYIFVAVSIGTVVSSVTVAGVATTLVSSASALNKLYVTNAPITTGTTATIVVNQSSSSAQLIFVLAGYYMTSTTPFATSGANGGINASGTLSIPLNTPSNGFVIMGSIIYGSSGTTTASLSGVTQRGVTASFASSDKNLVGSNDVSAAETPRSVSSSYTTNVPGAIASAFASSFA